MDALLRASARKASARKAGKSAAKTRGAASGRKLAWKGQGSLEEEIAGVERTLDFGASASVSTSTGARATRGSRRLAAKAEAEADAASLEPQPEPQPEPAASESVAEAAAGAGDEGESEAAETAAQKFESAAGVDSVADDGCVDDGGVDMPDFETVDGAEAPEVAHAPVDAAEQHAADAAAAAVTEAAERASPTNVREHAAPQEKAERANERSTALSEPDGQMAARKASTEHFREAVRLLQRAGLDARAELFNLMEQVNDYAMNEVFELDSDGMCDLAARLPAPVDGLDAAAAILVMVFGEEIARVSPASGRRASPATVSKLQSTSSPLVEKLDGRVVFADVIDLFEDDGASDASIADSATLDGLCDGMAALITDVGVNAAACPMDDAAALASPAPAAHEAVAPAATSFAKQPMDSTEPELDDQGSPAVLARTFFRNARERRRPSVAESDDKGASDEAQVVAASAMMCAEAINAAECAGGDEARTVDSDAENVPPTEQHAPASKAGETERESDSRPTADECDSVVITRTQRKTQRSVAFADDGQAEEENDEKALVAEAADAIERRVRVAFVDALEETAPETQGLSSERVRLSPAQTESKSDCFMTAATAAATGSATSDASIAVSEASHASEAISEAASDASTESGVSEPKPRRLSFNSSPSGSEKEKTADADDFGDGGDAINSTSPMASPAAATAATAATALVSPPQTEDSSDDFQSCDSGDLGDGEEGIEEAESKAAGADANGAAAVRPIVAFAAVADAIKAESGAENDSDFDGSIHAVTARKDFPRRQRRSRIVVIGDSESEGDSEAEVEAIDVGADSESDGDDIIADASETEPRSVTDFARVDVDAIEDDADTLDSAGEDSEADDEETAEDRAFINDASIEADAASEDEDDIEVESASDQEGDASESEAESEAVATPVATEATPVLVSSTGRPRRTTRARNTPMPKVFLDISSDEDDHGDDEACADSDESDFDPQDMSADETSDSDASASEGESDEGDAGPRHRPIRRKGAPEAAVEPAAGARGTAAPKAKIVAAGAAAAVDAAAAAIASIEIDSASDEEDIPAVMTHVPASTYTRKPSAVRAPQRPWPGKAAPSDDIFALPSGAPKATTAKKSAGKQPKETILRGRKFAAARSDLAAKLFEEYNARVFGSGLPSDLSIEWNAHLKTTAGMTKYKRVGAGSAAVYTASVELSTKVIDDENKLRRTLAHELCHAAAWLVDRVAKPPHGDTFRKWADAVTEAYPGIEVSTCHSYDIAYKYQYKCTGCAKIYGRHSKSIDLDKQGCGVCRSRLELLGTRKADGSITPARAARPPSAYALFTKEHFASVKASAPKGTPHGQIMKMLSAKWKEVKSAQQNAQGTQRIALSPKN